MYHLNRIIKSTAFLLSVFLISFSLTTFILAWTEPTSLPPDGNVSSPLNTGTNAQTKSGNLMLQRLAGDNPELKLKANTGVNNHWSIYQDRGTEELRFWKGDNRLTIDNTGNVGIGTTPTNKLTVAGVIQSTNNNAMWAEGGDDSSLWDINIANTLGVYGQQDSTIGSIKLGSNGGIISGYTGNVGIGTTTPGAKLDVEGDIRASTEIRTPSNEGDCPIWKDCDGDGKTGGNGDCDESCSTCYVDSTASTITPDGKDQNCDGVVDNQVTISVGVVANDKTGLSCDSKCTDAGYNTCLSAGNDAAGSNQKSDSYAWSNCTYLGEATAVSCVTVMFWCNQLQAVSGYSTNCRCATIAYR